MANAKEMIAVKCIYPCDFQWLVETAYNLGLFCFNVERSDEGRMMFGLIEQVINAILWMFHLLTFFNSYLPIVVVKC